MYAMKLIETYVGPCGQELQRTMIVSAHRWFRFRDWMTVDECARRSRGEVNTLDEWIQDHWWTPTRWGVAEEVQHNRNTADRESDIGGES